MARGTRKTNSAATTATVNGYTGGPVTDGRGLGTTGRMLVRFGTSDPSTCMKSLQQATGVRAASTADFGEHGYSVQELGGSNALVFHRLGVALVDMPAEQLHVLAADAASGIRAIEPERIVQAIDLPANSVEYLRGYRSAVEHLYNSMVGDVGRTVPEHVLTGAIDESAATWGLQKTKALLSKFSGKGIRVAVLDTGLDVSHPDFAGRTIVTRSFLEGEENQSDVHDAVGHGTHCIGTACGPRAPGTPPRYGIAWETDIYVGKVLSDDGFGTDGSILAGIDWAIASNCAIVSMSLGAPAELGQSFSPIFEQTAERALAAGTLIVAAAGNDSRRPDLVRPVGHPANCPSIMAVGALDSSMAVAPFSCGGLNGDGAEVDIAGPGVQVRSSWPRQLLYRTISGTSMATPHVAGIAALHAEANPGLRGRALWNIVRQSASTLPLEHRDVGVGIVQAP